MPMQDSASQPSPPVAEGRTVVVEVLVSLAAVSIALVVFVVANAVRSAHFDEG
jgi:hypothetical protein